MPKKLARYRNPHPLPRDEDARFESDCYATLTLSNHDKCIVRGCTNVLIEKEELTIDP